ncbi:hypothetical protein [Metaclostridioides mangenotii]|uniref:hypothetical protein n=1 Tax=Metaclostridioides mangenotii TaxID=1540 RepID=UPI0026E983A3|nr:hypothetical protein [Clostridioides mangenotii]
MKKILIVASMLLLVFTVGCNSKNDTGNNQKDKNVEILSNKKYKERINLVLDESRKYISDYTYVHDEEGYVEKTPENEEYQKLLESYKINEKKYKEMGEKFSKFRSKDEETNKIHDKLIQICIDKSNNFKERDELETKIREFGVKEWVNELEIEAGTVPENLMSEKERNEIDLRIDELDRLIYEDNTLIDVWNELERNLGVNLD